MSEWALIELGCAECHDEPLALPRGTFATPEAAKAAAGEQAWRDHPSGGYFTQWGSGGFWALPIASLARTGDDFL